MEYSEVNDEREKLKKRGYRTYKIRKRENISGVYLFCSFDLANSTAYKKDSKWIYLFGIIKNY